MEQTVEKSPADNIVLAKCGVECKYEDLLYFAAAIFPFRSFLVSLLHGKNIGFHLLEIELKFFFLPHFSQYFFRYMQCYQKITYKNKFFLHPKFILFPAAFLPTPDQHICKMPTLNQPHILQKSWFFHLLSICYKKKGVFTQ